MQLTTTATQEIPHKSKLLTVILEKIPFCWHRSVFCLCLVCPFWEQNNETLVKDIRLDREVIEGKRDPNVFTGQS